MIYFLNFSKNGHNSYWNQFYSIYFIDFILSFKWAWKYLLCFSIVEKSSLEYEKVKLSGKIVVGKKKGKSRLK